jgi:chromosomal replication initiator protein
MDIINKIISMTAEHFGVTEDMMRAPDRTKGARKRETVTARKVAMVLLKAKTQLSLKSIGREFGGRDHATVIHAEQSVQNLNDTDQRFRRDFNQIYENVTNMIEGSPFRSSYNWEPQDRQPLFI